ncbi:histidine kinase [Bengtsoniella intestinalis]|uniref:sensor histidine kinase n=1 Tax=Bengtsoniella intestinalis TaxID=3073143 RepID=UPI00391F0689
MNLIEQSWRTWWKIGRGVAVVAIIIVAVVWVCSSPRVSSAEETFQTEFFHSGWSQQVGDTQIPLDDIQDYIPVGVGESLIFTCTLPEFGDGQVFLFYTVDKEVRCYVDGELIQNFTMQEGYTILDTPGSAWNQVDLDCSMSGKSCTLVFTSPLGDYSSLCSIHFIENQYVNNVRLHCFWQDAASACVLFLVLVIIILVAFFTQQPYRKRYLLSLAQYFLVVLGWILAELNAYDLIFFRPVGSYLLGEIFRRLIPLALLYLTKNSTQYYWHPKVFKLLRIVAWGNFFIPLALQFTLGVSLLELRTVHTGVAMLVNIVLLLIAGEKLLHFKALQYKEYPCLAIPILIIFSSVDHAISYLNTAYYPFSGIWTGIGAIVFGVVTFAILTHINSKMEQEKESLAQNCRDLENATLGKQLEAHFIFNVLNTISAYCKTDPKEADRGIVAFASYLRTYLHLIKQTDNIPFRQEVCLVKEYLTMQQMRFGDELKFQFDTEYLDFDIPAFSVYTLVENAVIHGIRKQNNGGMITISTVKTGGVILVTIADTGAGFDTTLPIKETSVGVRNTKNRLALMNNATLNIESDIGCGTTVTVTIPSEL